MSKIHRMVEVGSDLRRSPSPSTLNNKGLEKYRGEEKGRKVHPALDAHIHGRPGFYGFCTLYNPQATERDPER